MPKHIEASLVCMFLILATACGTSPGDVPHVYSEQEIAHLKNLLNDRCKNEAIEKVYKTISADSIYLMKSKTPGGYNVVGLGVYHGHAGYSNHFTNPLYLFTRVPGLRTLEYDLDEVRQEVFGDKYATFDLTKGVDGERRKTLKSHYAVQIESITRPEQENLRIIGREIKVLDLATSELIAIKKEFFWIEPDYRRAGVAYDFCPKDQSDESFVGLFISKVFTK